MTHPGRTKGKKWGGLKKKIEKRMEERIPDYQREVGRPYQIKTIPNCKIRKKPAKKSKVKPSKKMDS